jgi:hypothetical protein
VAEEREVELRPAHAWDCPGCGLENFAKCIPAELTPAERARMREMTDLGEDQDADILASPTQVKCARCGREYPARAWGTPLDDDFDPHEAFGDPVPGR